MEDEQLGSSSWFWRSIVDRGKMPLPDRNGTAIFNLSLHPLT